MDSKVLFKKALEQATATVKRVESQHFKNATPCTDWDCHALVNHMLYELSWLPDLLAGKTVAQVGRKYDGDLLGKDHIKNWQKAADMAMLAVNKVDPKATVHLSYGDKSVSYYLNEISTDLLIHSWDTAQSYWCSLIMQPDMAEALYAVILPKQPAYTNSGLFGTPIEVPATARLQTRILALLGRREPEI